VKQCDEGGVSLRADHVGFMGYPRPTSPFLDSLGAWRQRCTSGHEPGLARSRDFSWGRHVDELLGPGAKIRPQWNKPQTKRSTWQTPQPSSVPHPSFAWVGPPAS